MIRLVTYADAPGGVPRLGVVLGGHGTGDRVAPLGPLGMVAALALPEAALRAVVGAAGRPVPLALVRVLPPVTDPPKIFCVGKNSKAHREELVRQDMLREDPQEPTGFVKLRSTMVGDGAEVERPEGITTLD